MAEMSLFQALHARTNDKARVCMTGHVIKCLTSLNTSNSTKTLNVDISYETFFFPSRKLRPQRTSGSRDYCSTT